VSIFVRVDVVQLFTLTVRVEVGSVIVTLTRAFPDATVTGLGVLGPAVRRLNSGYPLDKSHNVFVMVVKSVLSRYWSVP
jgi:hypothetical protein